MQYAMIITDSDDGKNVTVEMKRTDKAEDTDSSKSNAAAMMGAILNFLNGIDEDAVEDTQKIVVQ